MQINLNYIYYTLLLVTVVSSSLLSVLVASEGSAYAAAISEINNSTYNDSEYNSKELVPENKPAEENLHSRAEIHSSFEENLSSQPTHTPDGESQPDLLRGAVSQNSGVITDVNDPVPTVFTIGDTISAELKNAANTKATLVIDEAISESNNKTDSKSPPAHIDKSDPDVIDESNDTKSDEAGSKPGSDDLETEHFNDSLKQDDVIRQKDVQPKTPEDIPSFSEWTQKQLEEAERKKEGSNASIQNAQTNGRNNANKLRSKNYASPDCGAKIVASNPEASSAGSILSSSKDEYMLNTCTSRIWFVVELCEAIQVKKIELANFELFSSSPRDFTVSVSDRFPTREWNVLGQFTGKDERDMQSFSLNDANLFGKYVKVELHSHYGSEHFCPVSLFRAYGTSEFEVLETEERVQVQSDDDDDDDDDFEDTVAVQKGDAPSNLFGSARDAVMSLVKKAAQALVNSNNSANLTDQRTVNCSLTNLVITEKCITPSHIIVCDDCSDLFYSDLYGLLSCKSEQLNKLFDSSFVHNALHTTNICVDYGLNFNSKQTSSVDQNPGLFITAFLKPEYVAALCNILAMFEKKVVLNSSHEICTNLTSNVSTVDTEKHLRLESSLIDTPPALKLDKDSARLSDTLEAMKSVISTDGIKSEPESEISETVKIQPTKTLSEENVSVVEDKSASDEVHIVSSEKPPIDLFPTFEVDNPATVNESEKLQTVPIKSTVQTKTPTDAFETIENVTKAGGPNDTLLADNSGEIFDLGSEIPDSFLTELEQDNNSVNLNQVVTTTVTPPANLHQQRQGQQGQKESVFLRLHNRIKALERNMSLSTQYLEELSRRYKKQMEEMQRAFEKTLTVVNEESVRTSEYRKRTNEEWQRIEEQLLKLSTAVDLLMTDRNSWATMASWFVQLLITQLCIVAIILYFCGKTEPKAYVDANAESVAEVQVPARRKSVDVIGHESPGTAVRKRRPSEEALNISGTYEELLINDGGDKGLEMWIVPKADKRRRKRKTSILRRTNSNSTISACGGQKDSDNRSASSLEDTKAEYSRSPKPKKKSVEPNGVDVPTRVEELSYIRETSDTFGDINLYYNGDTEQTTKRVNGIKSKMSNPRFMKTAVSERSKRKSLSEVSRTELNSSEDGSQGTGSIDSSVSDVLPVVNGHNSAPALNRSVSFNGDRPIVQKKGSKVNSGFKKLFRKVF